MSDKEKTSSVNASAFSIGALRPGTVQVTVGKQIDQKALHTIIDTIISQHGCPACGLGGIDILIRQQDPRVIDAFQHISDVREVSVYR